MTTTMIDAVRLNAVLRRAGIDTIEQLEERLGASPPIYSVAPDPEHKRWVILSKPRLFGKNRTVAWSESEKDARLICEVLRADVLNGNA